MTQKWPLGKDSGGVKVNVDQSHEWGDLKVKIPVKVSS